MPVACLCVEGNAVPNLTLELCSPEAEDLIRTVISTLVLELQN